MNDQIIKEARAIMAESQEIFYTVAEMESDTVGVELFIRRKATEIRKAAERIRDAAYYNDAPLEGVL